MSHHYKEIFANKTKKLLALWPILVLYIGFYLVGVGCPIKFLTGLSCPGCGFTRAFMSLITLNFKEVFYYHPAFLFFPLSFVTLYYFNDNKICRFIGWLSILIIIVVYFIRILNPNDLIVYFNFEESAIFRLFKIML